MNIIKSVIKSASIKISQIVDKSHQFTDLLLVTIMA